MEPKDIKMKQVKELLFSAGLMNLEGKVITVRPSKTGAKWSKPKSIDGKFTDLKEVLYLLYLAKALVEAGIRFSANTPFRFLLNAEQSASTDIVVAA